MVEVIFYKNGYEISGHVNITTCVGLSSMAILTGECIGLDDCNSWGKSGDGQTFYVFDETNDRAKRTLSAFKKLLIEYIDENEVYKKDEIKITEKDEKLKKSK